MKISHHFFEVRFHAGGYSLPSRSLEGHVESSSPAYFSTRELALEYSRNSLSLFLLKLEQEGAIEIDSTEKDIPESGFLVHHITYSKRCSRKSLAQHLNAFIIVQPVSLDYDVLESLP